MRKLKINWKNVIVAVFAALIVGLSLSMDFCLFDMVKENSILIEEILDNKK